MILAENGLDGLSKANGTYPDLSSYGFGLPDMDGVEAARRIHEPKLRIYLSLS